MIITVFRKKKQTKDGKKTFDTYFSKLTKKDGDVVTVNVKFTSDVELSEKFPCNIIVDNTGANLSTTNGVTDAGKEYTDKTLWIKSYEMGEEFVDTSLDEFV